MVRIETKYAAPFSQLYHLLYLLYPPDLSSSQAFLSPLSVLPSSIILVILIYYLYIITMKKLMNLDRLACYCCYACFISFDSLSVRTGLILNSICTICKSFSRILWLIKDKQLINIKRLTYYCNRNCAYFIFICFYWQLKLGSITNLFSSICVIWV